MFLIQVYQQPDRALRRTLRSRGWGNNTLEQGSCSALTGCRRRGIVARITRTGTKDGRLGSENLGGKQGQGGRKGCVILKRSSPERLGCSSTDSRQVCCVWGVPLARLTTFCGLLLLLCHRETTAAVRRVLNLQYIQGKRFHDTFAYAQKCFDVVLYAYVRSTEMQGETQTHIRLQHSYCCDVILHRYYCCTSLASTRFKFYMCPLLAPTTLLSPISHYAQYFYLYRVFFNRRQLQRRRAIVTVDLGR